MIKKLCSVVVFAMLPHVAVFAENNVAVEPSSVQLLSAADALQQLIQASPNFSADFSQDVTNEMGRLVERSTGKVWIKQPHQFRWHTMTPYQQIVLGDQSTVSSYDIDLEQVILRSTSDLLGESPALLLTGEQKVSTLFNVSKIETTQAGSQIFQLLPKKKQGSLELVKIFFNGQLLSRMEITDGLGQLTFVEFSNMAHPESIPAPLFELNAGPDVDIVDQRGAKAAR